MSYFDSHPRECFTSSGKPKKRYDTRADARRAARSHEDRGSDPGKPYRCDVCDYFHLGHYPATGSRRRDRLRRRHRPKGDR